MYEENRNKRTARNIILLFLIFSFIMLVVGIIAYNLAAATLKNQLVMKCKALAATVAVIIAEDSDGYAAFLEDMDMNTDYYRRTKALMMKLKRVNVEHVTYIYTEACVDGDTMMYVIGGEDPSSPVYTPPGVKDAITDAEREAYSKQIAVAGTQFVNTTYGIRLSAYEPIIHKDTGEFLGLVGADITRLQYNSIMRIFIAQTTVSLIAGMMVFAVAMRWLSGNVKLTIKEAEQRLALENAALDRVNRLKTDMIATVSHEMRTPLAVMMGYAQLTAAELKEKGIDEQATADLDAMALEAQRLAQLVEKMLNVSVSRQFEEEIQSASVDAVIRQITQLYAPILERKKTRLKVSLQEKLPPVSCSPNELTQILFNLINNADKHIKDGEVKVVATLAEDKVFITVSDTGTGIAPDLLPHVFERYRHGEGSGTGLGLAICKEIVEARGGIITIESILGKGTTVNVTLLTMERGSQVGA